jgi:hypothetical protein
MNRVDAWRMIQRRAAALGIRRHHGLSRGGGTLENAQATAAHESPRITKLYDRTGDEITLDEVERITFDRRGLLYLTDRAPQDLWPALFPTSFDD